MLILFFLASTGCVATAEQRFLRVWEISQQAKNAFVYTKALLAELIRKYLADAVSADFSLFLFLISFLYLGDLQYIKQIMIH